MFCQIVFDVTLNLCRGAAKIWKKSSGSKHVPRSKTKRFLTKSLNFFFKCEKTLVDLAALAPTTLDNGHTWAS